MGQCRKMTNAEKRSQIRSMPENGGIVPGDIPCVDAGIEKLDVLGMANSVPSGVLR
jgi:hypothetical protein